MKKTDSNSTLEIWGVNYINRPEIREPKDINKTVIQIESTVDADVFIVEVIDNDK